MTIWGYEDRDAFQCLTIHTYLSYFGLGNTSAAFGVADITRSWLDLLNFCECRLSAVCTAELMSCLSIAALSPQGIADRTERQGTWLWPYFWLQYLSYEVNHCLPSEQAGLYFFSGFMCSNPASYCQPNSYPFLYRSP